MKSIDFADIRLLVLDVDGVLSNGQIFVGPEGREYKAFSVKDGAGLKYFRRVGGKVAWISGRQSDPTTARARELGIDALRQGITTKLPALEEVCAELGVTPAQTAVMGDDLPDLPMLRAAGFSAAPADAMADVRAEVDYVCELPGGHGCVREVVEHILRQAGTWEQIMARYTPAEDSRP